MLAAQLVFIRWFLLFGAVASLLQGTVLFGFVQRRILGPWLAQAERRGAHVPTAMRDPRLQRAWPLLMTLLFGGLWWYLGTPAGHAWAVRAHR